MPAAGTTGDLYLEKDNPTATLETPPTPPAPVPPPTKPAEIQTVNVKHRMADEGPDGRVRDTSADALRPGNDLNFRNISDEEQAAPKETPVEPSKEAAPEPPKEAAPPPPAEPKVYAGKFKSPEELEKGYLEAQKAMHKAMEEKAALEREKLAAPPAPPAPKTPEQLAAEEAEKNQFLNEFIADPKKVITEYQQKAIQQTQVALAAQQVTHDWRKANPDLVEHEFYVAAEAMRLAQADPEIGRDPARLMQTATDNFRQVTGKLRTEGAKEALTQETRTIPLLSGTTPPATEQPSSKAPLTTDEAFSLHLKMLKEQEQRSHRGLRR